MDEKNFTAPICIILGTRPEIIKMSPVIHECERKGVPYFILHTGQHYSKELDSIFFQELKIREPKYNLEIGSLPQAEMVALMMDGIAKILLQENPSVVLVHGDTNSALAGALAANKCSLPLAHVEAGLRSYDRTMPEETNRVLIDHMSDVLFAPTSLSHENALKEHIPTGHIEVVGNTVVEVVLNNLPSVEKQEEILTNYSIVAKKYGVLTLHRPSNVDVKDQLKTIFSNIAKEWDQSLPLLFFAHPRTQKQLKEFRIEIPDSVQLHQPIGYFTLLALTNNAHMVLTDSGGMQEESSILGIPCVTIRPNTERPETLHIYSNHLAKEPGAIGAALNSARVARNWEHPFGNGDTSEKIVSILQKKYGSTA
jgi:UDP-N-acetylglucosamine 2-epimerase (non-hydrolysing)